MHVACIGNLGRFKHLLGLLDHELSVIGISETKLNDSTLGSIYVMAITLSQIIG